MTLQTKTGKKFGYSWAGIADMDNNLYFGVNNMTATEALSIFSNKDETGTLRFYPDDNSDVFEEKRGYTRFVSIRIDVNNNTVNIGLGREYAT